MFCKICYDILRVPSSNVIFHSFCRFYLTHYQVLNLPKTCTSKQIKNAFIKLSKEHHPDVNKSKQAHAKFQQISEAYKVLGKAETRRNYDLGLANSSTHPSRKRHYTETYYEQTGRNPQYDPQFWVNRDRSREEFYKNKSYYGIDGVPRLPNGVILMCCVLFAFIGLGLQFIAISKSMTFKREALIIKSLEAENVLNETREAASANGNEAQLETLKTRLLGKMSKETDNQ